MTSLPTEEILQRVLSRIFSDPCGPASDADVTSSEEEYPSVFPENTVIVDGAVELSQLAGEILFFLENESHNYETS